MRRIIMLAIGFMVLMGCAGDDTTPANVLKVPEMQNVMWDMFLAQSMAQQRASADSTTTVVVETKRLSAEVLKIHGISENKFSESYQWYLRHPVLLNRILDSIYNKNSAEEAPHLSRPVPGETQLKKVAE